MLQWVSTVPLSTAYLQVSGTSVDKFDMKSGTHTLFPILRIVEYETKGRELFDADTLAVIYALGAVFAVVAVSGVIVLLISAVQHSLLFARDLMVVFIASFNASK